MKSPSRATQEMQAGPCGLYMQRCAHEGTGLARELWSELAFLDRLFLRRLWLLCQW